MHAAINQFNLKATLESGQIFRWEKIGSWHYIVAGDAIVKIRQDKNKIIYSSSKEFDVPAFFDLKNKHYGKIMKDIGKNKKLAAAVAKYRGLRIIKQQPWECTASFICSSFSNIRRIKANLNSVAEQYGQKIEYDGYSSHAFPTAAAIADNPARLDSCGLGYRKKYLAETAKKVSSGFDFNALPRSYGEAKKQIMQLDGVGEKVADCILLFSLGFTEPFPVDVWIQRAVANAYFKSSKISAKAAAEFGRRTFGKNAGYAQQFLYHFERNK
ncbi:DNA repair protein [Candidatus Woesearchaeota archaeon]|nr:DNA repair protein [Candidatus Woesearchaeota archaeon]